MWCLGRTPGLMGIGEIQDGAWASHSDRSAHEHEQHGHEPLGSPSFVFAPRQGAAAQRPQQQAPQVQSKPRVVIDETCNTVYRYFKALPTINLQSQLVGLSGQGHARKSALRRPKVGSQRGHGCSFQSGVGPANVASEHEVGASDSPMRGALPFNSPLVSAFGVIQNEGQGSDLRRDACTRSLGTPVSKSGVQVSSNLGEQCQHERSDLSGQISSDAPSSASEVGFVSRFVLQDVERARLTQLRAQRLWPFVDLRQHSKWQETIARRRVSKDALLRIASVPWALVIEKGVLRFYTDGAASTNKAWPAKCTGASIGVVVTTFDQLGREHLVGMFSAPLATTTQLAQASDPFCVSAPSAPVAELAALAVGFRVARMMCSTFSISRCEFKTDCLSARDVILGRASASANDALVELARTELRTLQSRTHACVEYIEDHVWALGKRMR